MGTAGGYALIILSLAHILIGVFMFTPLGCFQCCQHLTRKLANIPA